MRPLVVITILTGLFSFPASPQAVGPRIYLAPHQQKLERVLKQALPSRNLPLSPLRSHVLEPLHREQFKRSSNTDGPLQIGVHRPLDSSLLQSAQRDGNVWRIRIQSPGALAMRLHFTSFAVSAGQVWIHDGSGEEERVMGPYSGLGVNNDGDFWSDILFSDTVTVEYKTEALSKSVPFRIEEISHQFSTQAAPVVDKAAAASCELDVNCYPDWAFTAKGTARLSFEKSDGSYVCSGALLNTRTNSFVPYLLTANHCIDNEAVARTLQAIWFYQKDRCNGTLPNSGFPKSLGATLVVTGDRSRGDFTLLKLNSVPDGVTFQGWDPTEKPLGSDVTVVHHPAGDFKRISFGRLVADSSLAQNFYRVLFSNGVTEGGSSGSGIYSAPGVLIGTLSTGPKVDTTEGYCKVAPFTGSYGKFSSFYPLIRDVLDGGGSTTTPPPSSSTVLTSGVARTFSLAAVSGPTLFSGARGFNIVVPQGATRLDITLRSATSNADLDLFVRAGEDVNLTAGRVTADYSSESETGDEQISITASSTPALRAGTYYIAVALLTNNVNVNGTITATVTNASTSTSSAPVLRPGVAQAFILPAVTGPTLFSNESGFQVNVPQGATRLEVKLASATPGVDLDLFVRYGQPPVINNNRITADHASEGPGAIELVAITTSSTPPLRAGTYYIAFGSFTPGIPVSAVIVATVATGSAPPPSSGNVLTSGRAQTFNFAAVNGPTLFNGQAGYTIVVPPGATSLDVVLKTTTANADVDLFARYNQDVTVTGGDIVADHGSTSPTGEERLTITASSNPPLRAGTYYISLALFTPNLAATGTLTATVTSSSAPPPPTSFTLTSGRSRTLLFNPVATPTLFNGNQSFAIDVPANATRLDVQLTGELEGADWDLFVSHGKDNSISNREIVADFRSESPGTTERITITPQSTPQLQPGRYYISIAIFTTKTVMAGSLVATVTTGEQPSSSAPVTLTAGQQARFSLPAVDAPTVFVGNRSFQVTVPPGSTAMRIQVISDNPEVDVDLYARYQAEITANESGIIADHGSEGPDGNETLTVTTASTPPLRAGLYYISLASFTKNLPSTGSIVVTFSSQPVAPQNTSGEALLSGIPARYVLPPVETPSLFAGSSAYRIAVDSRHTALRLHVTGNAAMYVRRGAQPAVVDGRLLTDFVSENGDVVIDGASLRPGVYFIALSHGSNEAAAGTVTATAETLSSTHLQAASFDGVPVDAKQDVEVRYELPDTKAATADAGTLVKNTLRKKKNQSVKVEGIR